MSFLSSVGDGIKTVAYRVQRNPVLVITAGVWAVQAYEAGPVTPLSLITVLTGFLVRSQVTPAGEAEADLAALQDTVTYLNHQAELALAAAGAGVHGAPAPLQSPAAALAGLFRTPGAPVPSEAPTGAESTLSYPV